MERPHITVAACNIRGVIVRYDANHISIERENVDGKMVSRLSFLCSGSRTTLDPEDVVSIEFNKTGAQQCSECDQSIYETR